MEVVLVLHWSSLVIDILRAPTVLTKSSKDECSTGSNNHVRFTDHFRSSIIDINRSKDLHDNIWDCVIYWLKWVDKYSRYSIYHLYQNIYNYSRDSAVSLFFVMRLFTFLKKMFFMFLMFLCFIFNWQCRSLFLRESIIFEDVPFSVFIKFFQPFLTVLSFILPNFYFQRNIRLLYSV